LTILLRQILFARQEHVARRNVAVHDLALVRRVSVQVHHTKSEKLFRMSDKDSEKARELSRVELMQIAYDAACGLFFFGFNPTQISHRQHSAPTANHQHRHLHRNTASS
jgi:hypothetical protein